MRDVDYCISCAFRWQSALAQGTEKPNSVLSGPGQWLSESNFLKGLSGPSEAVDAVTSTPEEAETVKVSIASSLASLFHTSIL